MNEKSKRLADSLEKAEVNVRKVTVLGAFAHIDTYEKYGDKVKDLMSSAGAKLLMEKNGAHMDGLDGYRLVFKF
jgi:hypothetical protein